MFIIFGSFYYIEYVNKCIGIDSSKWCTFMFGFMTDDYKNNFLLIKYYGYNETIKLHRFLIVPQSTYINIVNSY